VSEHLGLASLSVALSLWKTHYPDPRNFGLYLSSYSPQHPDITQTLFCLAKVHAIQQGQNDTSPRRASMRHHHSIFPLLPHDSVYTCIQYYFILSYKGLIIGFVDPYSTKDKALPIHISSKPPPKSEYWFCWFIIRQIRPGLEVELG
jgi:hypothetical protein